MGNLGIYGIGNPLIDIVVEAEDDDLEVLGLDKGIMHLVDLDERGNILERVKNRRTAYSCGGSAPNTLIFLSALGVNTALAGKIGGDAFGKRYSENLPGENMESQLVVGTGATGSSVILVTPDSERTMNTYLGTNREFSVDDVDLAVVRRAQYIYFTGYMWDTDLQKRAVLEATKVCRDNGGIIAFDVADPFAVNRNRDAFRELIRANTDIVFANREEAKLLFGTDTGEEAVTALSEICDVAVVKDGAAGSLIKRKGKETERIPVRRVQAVDTTGAGDMYAAGFIYGIISGMGDRESGICASYLASRVVETWGAQFPPATRGVVAKEVLRGEWRYTS
jgi:sugar/nucleoside kinase (ribokinase family)